MRKILPFVLLALSLTASAEELPTATPEEVGISSERLSRMSEFAAEQVAEGRHAGMVTLLARHGRIVHFEVTGLYGIDNDKPMEKDTLFRLFSMTKPVTAVAMMMLYEEGRFQMSDPVSKYVPAMGNLDLYQDGQVIKAGLEITIEQLFTHTAGLSYGFFADDPVDKYYQEANLWQSEDLHEFIERLSKLPLRSEPGTRYYYSMATDVLGAVIESISGQSLDAFFRERIFEPLGMRDTFFNVPADKLHRLSSNHIWNAEENRMDLLPDDVDSRMFRASKLFSGGAGLVSTAMDYMKFCEMLRRGGNFNGVRLLGPKTVQYMTSNHLTDAVRNFGADENPSMHLNKGQSVGLGFGVVTNPGINEVISSQGEYSWGGLADTRFFIDPQEDLVAILMTQLVRSPWRTANRMRVATYQALEKIN
ncbi:MAG: serine hydrolase domain-containing protein [Woeseia sp.]